MSSAQKTLYKTPLIFIVISAGLFVLLLAWFVNRNIFNTNQRAAESISWTAFTDNFETNLNQWEDKQGSLSLSTERFRTGTKSVKLQTGAQGETYLAHTFSENHNMSKPYVFVYDDGVVTPDPKYAFFEISYPPTNKKILLGIQTNKNVYIYCPTGDRNVCIDTPITRSVGWRRLIFFITPKGTFAKLDNRPLADLPSVINRPDAPAVNPDITASLRVRLLVSGSNAAFYFDDLGEYTVNQLPDLAGLLDQAKNNYINTYGNITETYISGLAQNILDQYGHYCTVSTYPCPTANRRSYSGHTYEEYEAQRNLMIGNFRNLSYYLRASGQPANIAKADIIDTIFRERGLARTGNSLLAQSFAQSNILGASDSIASANAALDKSEGASYQQASTEQATSYAGKFNPGGPWWCNPGNPYSEFIANSSGEENSWPARDLDAVYIRGTDDQGHPLSQDQKDDILAQSKLFAFHSLTRGESTPQVRTPLHTYPAFTSRTLYNDFEFDNHVYHPHPTYAFSTVMDLLSMAYNHKMLYGSIPPEFLHNVQQVFQKAEQYVDYRTFQYKGELIVRDQRDRNNNNVSDYGTLNPEQDPTCSNPPSNFPNDGSRFPGNIFLETGRDDWGVDAIFRRLKLYALANTILHINSYTDPQTGFTTSDLSQHAIEYFGYIHQEFLFRWERPQIQYTTLEIPPSWPPIDNPMYRWWRNSQVIDDLVQYIQVVENQPPATVSPTPNPSVTLAPSLTSSPTPSPTHSPTSTVTPTIVTGIQIQTPSCIYANTTGNSVTVSWIHPEFIPTWLDITSHIFFLEGFNTKLIRGSISTYLPAGFSRNLTIQPNTTYKVRLRTGFRTTDSVTFRIPACSPATH